jgi:hypothetical protein
MGIIANSFTRVEDHTSNKVNQQIEDRTASKAAYYADHPELIDRRLEELDREWDIERWLQMNSAVLTVAGLALAAFHDRRWLILPVGVQLFFMQHGLQGWCPPVPAFRRMGVRTLREIEAERNALRALRGDFDGAEDDPSRALRAATGGRSADEQRRRRTVTPTRRRVRDHTSVATNARIDNAMSRRVAYYARNPDLARRRLHQLEKEWDIERVIEVEAPTLTLTGIGLYAFGRRSWLGLPLLVQGMMVLHAVNGFYPLLPVLRKLGLRTVDEIAAERTALQLALGHFNGGDGDGDRGQEAMEATLAPF